MASYVKSVYRIDYNAFKGWKMHDAFEKIMKNLIEAVFVKLKDSIADAQACVPELCNTITYCPDRQISAFSMVYSALYLKKDPDSFEHFVENKIATLKSYIFDIIATPTHGSQNVHVLNFLKYKLQDKLGFVDVSYQPRMGTFGQDVFIGHVGNVLDAFYTKFTPRYVIKSIVDDINISSKRLNDAGAFLHVGLQDKKYARRVFEFLSEDDAANLVPSSIKAEGVGDILLSMEILEKNL